MKALSATLVSVSLLVAVGCGGSNAPTSPSSDANFNLMLQDSPFSDAKAVLVTFSLVEAHRTGSDFTALPFASGTARTCDLKKLQSAQDVLGVGVLPAAQYTMVRLVVASAALYFDNPSVGAACAPSIATPAGRSAPLNIPSGEVKLNQPFTVGASGATTMLLDFNGDQSIHDLGNGSFSMTPVITVVSVH
jgi:hypothetical protein